VNWTINIERPPRNQAEDLNQAIDPKRTRTSINGTTRVSTESITDLPSVTLEPPKTYKSHLDLIVNKLQRLKISDMATFKLEYMQVLPDFTGDQATLAEFISISEHLITNFFDHDNPANFQNYILLRGIKSKVKGEAASAIASFEFTGWDALKQALLATYADKRDLETLTIELCNLRQGKMKPLEFYKKVQENLNLKISYIKTHYNSDSAALIAESHRLALRVFVKQLNNPLSEHLHIHTSPVGIYCFCVSFENSFLDSFFLIVCFPFGIQIPRAASFFGLN